MERTVISLTKGNRFGGTWGSDVPLIDTNSDDYKSAVETVTASSAARSDGSGEGIWSSIIENSGGWITSIGGSISSIVQAKTGNYPTYQYDNTPKVLAIAGIGAVVLIIILLIIFKK